MRCARERLLAHVRPARKMRPAFMSRYVRALTAGDRVAASDILTGVMRQGHTVTTEIYISITWPSTADCSANQITRDVPTNGE